MKSPLALILLAAFVSVTQVEFVDGEFQLISSGSDHLRDKDAIRRFH